MEFSPRQGSQIGCSATRPLLRITHKSASPLTRGILMYEAYYGLREKPFSILPDPDLIYWGQHHRLAFAMLEFGVMNSAGFTVITGEIGSGKTTLVRYLLRRLDSHLAVGLIANTPHRA